MATPVVRIVPASTAETVDPYAALLEPVTSERTRAKIRRSIELLVKRHVEFDDLLSQHTAICDELATVARAQCQLPHYSLERAAYDQRFDQLDREASRMERRMALLEHLIEAAS